MVRRVAWLAVLLVVGGVGSASGGLGCKRRAAPAAGPVAAGGDAGVVAGDAGAEAAPPDAAPTLEPELPAVIPTAPPRRLWTGALATEAEFLDFSREQGGERFTKFVVDLKTDAIYYFDVDVYRVHKDFIFAELYRAPKTKQAVRVFDANYGKAKPEFLLCYLVHHVGPDRWTFAFWEGDLATPAHVERAYRRMKATFWNGDAVAFRPDSSYQEHMARGLRGVPVVTNDQLYKDSVYAAFNTGVAIGVLRVVAPGARVDELVFDRDDIVILAEALPDLTPVAGILSETFSTPLSHVSLRAKAWGIPNVGLKGAHATYAALVGETVYFAATDVGHTLRRATADEVAAWRARQIASTQVVLPAADLDATALATLDQLRAADATAYGAKAANLGEVVAGRPVGFSVPPGFGVPIHWYARHLAAAGLDAGIEAMLADERFRRDAAHRRRALDQLRRDVVAAPLEPALVAEVERALAALTGGDERRGVFVRSSTNAEDLPGFSGAGLYDTVPNVKGAAAVAEAIKVVWASVWNLRAYEEREHYRIDHTRVFGAVLVQLGVDATAAGVLVTVHPTDPAETVYTINAKSGLGLRVVAGTKVPESLLYDYQNKGLRVLSRSDEETMLVFDAEGGVREVPNPHPGKPVLTNKRALLLGGVAHRLTRLFPPGRPLDIEWLFEGDTLHVVQVRPYVVR